MYIYDSETPNSDPQPVYNGWYYYTAGPYGISLTIGELTFQTDTANLDFGIGLSNNPFGAPYDYYGVTSYNNLPLDDLSIDRLHWQLEDDFGTAISSTELPLLPPDLSKWQGNALSVMGGRYPFPSPDEKTLFGINGHIYSVWLVPEPATLLLFSLGGLLLRKRR